MKNKIKMRCYECKKCNKTMYFQSNTKYETICRTCKNEMQLIWEHNYRPNDGLKAIKNSNIKENKYPEFNAPKPKIECPYCHSTDTKKISGTSKFINTAIWGPFGTKRFKEWHCNKCGSDF